MKKSIDVIEAFTRMLAHRELERVRTERRAESNPSKRMDLFEVEDMIIRWLDELDVAKGSDVQAEQLSQGEKVGGTD